MNTPEKDKQDNSSENDKQAEDTVQQEKTSKPVSRGRTFGAPGHEKRG